MAKKRVKNENRHLYIALDTCTLSELANIYQVMKTYNFNFDTPIGKIQEKMINPDVVNGKPISKKFNPDKDYAYNKLPSLLSFLYRSNAVSKLSPDPKAEETYRLLITPTVFSEYKHEKNPVVKECDEFVRDFCYVPKVNILNYTEYSQKINDLAVAYSKDYIHKGKVKPAPMDDATVDSNGQVLPSKDARIMAEASYFGANLCTLNARHFIYDGSTATNKEELEELMLRRRRSKGIYRINKQKGYYIKDVPFKDGKMNLGYQAYTPYEIEHIFANNRLIQEGFATKYVLHDNVDMASIFIKNPNEEEQEQTL